MPIPYRSKTATLALTFLGLLVLFTLFRLAFLAYFQGLQPMAQREVWWALFLGMRFDARLAAILVAPAWLLLTPGDLALGVPSWRRRLAPLGLAMTLAIYLVMVTIAMVDDRGARPWLLAFLAAALLQYNLFRGFGLGSRAGARVWVAYGAVVIGITIVATFVDFGSYSYIHTRLNGTLLMFTENAGTSLKMVWQSYPVVKLTLLMAAFLLGSLWLLRRLFRGLTMHSLPPIQSWVLRVGVSLVLMFAMYGKFSRYPLRWGEAFEAKQVFHAHLALNPMLFLLETRRDMDGGFDLAKVKATHQVMADYFGCEPSFEDGNPSLLRTIPARPRVTGTPNVVFIQLESFAGFKTGILGNKLDPTPFFDSLCRKGIFFDRFYVPMENTSRSMFCTISGIPDVSAVENATRNPLILEQASALHALNAYDKSFSLGGSANWAQIRGILKRNFPDIVLFEEGSYKAPVVDVWGVSDADLLLETHERLAAKPGPFWAYIQTSGNHPPFTIPKHLQDFQIRNLDKAQLSANGFVGNDEFNALRLMDYSLAKYFEAAEKAPYFRNTIFVLWADHGLPRGATDHRYGDLALAVHHIPLLIYAPGFVSKGERVHTVGAQMDLMPTVMSFLGHATRTRTLGKDLLDPAWADKAMAFTFTTFRRPPAYGILRGDWYLTRQSDGRKALYRLDDPQGQDVAARDPQRSAEMERLAVASYEWSKYLLSHNKPMEAKR